MKTIVGLEARLCLQDVWHDSVLPEEEVPEFSYDALPWLGTAKRQDRVQGWQSEKTNLSANLRKIVKVLLSNPICLPPFPL